MGCSMRIESSSILFLRQANEQQQNSSQSLTAIAKIDAPGNTRPLGEVEIRAAAKDINSQFDQVSSTGLDETMDVQNQAIARFTTQDVHNTQISTSTASSIEDGHNHTLLMDQTTIESLAHLTFEENILITKFNQADGEITELVGVEVFHNERTEIHQKIQLETYGELKTTDGRTIEFAMALDFQRDSLLETASHFAGNRDLIDPLMLNLNGESISLSDKKFEFDLNSDGTKELLARPAQGTGFLVLDKNQNGKIDNGTELFGPQTNSGFTELSQLDDDGNGWIDENDRAYSEIQFMTFQGDEIVLTSLSESGIGALNTGSVAAGYSLMNDDADEYGSVANSGLALSEDGRALFLQEFHYSVERQEIVLPHQANENPLSVFQQDIPIINDREDTFVSLESLGTVSSSDSASQVTGNNSIPQPLQGEIRLVAEEHGSSTYRATTAAPGWEKTQLSNPFTSRTSIKIEKESFKQDFHKLAQAHHKSLAEIAKQEEIIAWEAPDADEFKYLDNIQRSELVLDAKENSGRWLELKMLIEQMREQKETQLLHKNDLQQYSTISDLNV